MLEPGQISSSSKKCPDQPHRQKHVSLPTSISHHDYELPLLLSYPNYEFLPNHCGNTTLGKMGLILIQHVLYYILGGVGGLKIRKDH